MVRTREPQSRLRTRAQDHLSSGLPREAAIFAACQAATSLASQTLRRSDNLIGGGNWPSATSS